jgi:hypothetical protein
VSEAPRGTAIVVWDSSTRAGPEISAPSASRSPSYTAVPRRCPASGQNTCAVWPGVPGPDGVAAVTAPSAAGTRARTRSAKTSAAWNAEAADGP